jgi:hypothetical protein
MCYTHNESERAVPARREAGGKQGGGDMTRKDFEALAAALNAARYVSAEKVWDVVAVKIAEVCASDNPRFDSARFFAACSGKE